MTELRLNDRVELRSCTGCAPGRIVAFIKCRHLFEVIFDDEPTRRRLIRPSSLQLVEK